MSATSVIEINVHELVGKLFTGGDLIFNSQGIDRAREGTRLHKLWQDSRTENYLSEVSLDHTFCVENHHIRLRGRMDGLYPDREIVTIEEIKSTTNNPQSCIIDPPNNHICQVIVYAYLYSVDRDLSDDKLLCLNLIYLATEGTDFGCYEKVVSVASLKEQFDIIINKFLHWHIQIENWKKLRNTSAQSLEFPYANYRSGQRKLAVKTYQTIKQKKRLIAAAPTGIGKTVSTLFPSIKAIGEGLIERIFYLTARNTVQAIGEQSLRLMVNHGLNIRSVTIVAREKTCLDMEGDCRSNQCIRCKGYFDRLPQAMQEILENKVIDQEKIKEIADKHSLCPFEFSLDASLVADVIFCDYNYAFHPRARLQRHFVDNIKEHVLLMDEGHHLVERARDMFSANLSAANLRRLSRKIRNEQSELATAIIRISQWIERQVRINMRASNTESSSTSTAPVELEPLLQSVEENIQQIAQIQGWEKLDAEVKQLSFDILWFQQTLREFDEDYLCLLEQISDNTTVQLFCMDPSTRIEQTLLNANASILFSATLRPLNYFLELLDWPQNSYKLDLESPFPPENLNFLIDGSLSLRYRDRHKNSSEVMSRIVSFIENCPGNIMIFSPSHEYQKSLVHGIQRHCPNRDYIIQEQEMSQKDRHGFLEKFQESKQQSNIVGFAVLGGLFSEGIDLIGDQLKGAVIIGVGAPPPNIRQKELQEYFQRQFKQGFEFGFRLPGFQRVLQAVGRVIRSTSDKGSVLLIDQRYLLTDYKKLFPSHWRPKLVNNVEAIEKQLKQFWNV